MRKFFARLDLFLITIPILISATSVATIYALVKNEAVADSALWWKQAIFIGIGTVAATVAGFFDYRHFKNINLFLYIFFFILLVLLLFWGKGTGASRWLELGFFQIQPSEFFKMVLILWQAAFLSKENYVDFWRSLPYLFFSLVPAVLILKQPDLGTTIIILCVTGGTLILAKPTKGVLISIFVGFFLVSSLILLATFKIQPFSKILRDYQRERILTFLNPARDPQGSGYNLMQSKTAVGAGGLLGKGFRGSTQTQLKYVPAPATDFIFSAFAEAFGYLGSIVLLVFYALFLWRIILAAEHSRDSFGRLIAIGFFFMFIVQIFINIGMTIGVAPITGIPLPFLSYGGSSLLTAFIASGILQSIVIRERMLEF